MVISKESRMKCTIPEISWHNRGPVLSVDLQPGTWRTSSPQPEDFWRLASGGADSHVLIWHLTVNKAGEANITCVADLERHQRTVNVVRFSPSGDTLASGDDESVIILWKQREASEIPLVTGDDSQNKEQWHSWKVLRGHIEDIYDLSWSPDSNMLASASLDNSVILWNVQKGKKHAMLSDYVKGFPQGVTWDPTNKYVATISSDRLCRLIDINAKKTVQRVSKSRIPTPAGNPLEGKVVRLFYDDTFKSFFRRLTFSPDGLLLIVPSGIIEPQESTEKTTNCTVIFSRHSLKEPIAILPSYDEVTNAVRCCPVYFTLREDGPKSMMALPYRMVFAVATDNSVIIYDTQQIAPIAVISNIHYTRLTDLSWSSDASILIASSSDGYCSIINFQKGELGEIYKMPESNKEQIKADIKDTKEEKPTPFVELDVNAVDNDISGAKSKDNDMNGKEIKTDSAGEGKTGSVVAAKTNSVAADKTGNMEVEEEGKSDADETEDFRLVLEDTVAESTDKTNGKATPPKTEKPPPTLLSRTPRRVQLITLSSPKRTKAE